MRCKPIGDKRALLAKSLLPCHCTAYDHPNLVSRALQGGQFRPKARKPLVIPSITEPGGVPRAAQALGVDERLRAPRRSALRY